MKLFLFGELNEDTIQELCPSAAILGTKRLSGYQLCCTRVGRSFLKQGSGEVAGIVVECAPSEVWKLDQWKNVLLLCRKELEEDLYGYFSLYDTYDGVEAEYAARQEITDFAAQITGHNSIQKADIHLLMPGSIDKQLENGAESYLGQKLQEHIENTNKEEYNSEFLKDCQRYALGKVDILLSGGEVQRAVLTVMEHTGTGLCVVDVFVPAVMVSTHRILNEFCGNIIKLRMGRNEFKVDDFCREIGVTPYGSKRSMVFAYEKLEEELLLNLLVNEEKPMGKIMGTHFKELISNNLAQYDTAEVYASEVTMLEMTDNVECDLFARIQSQAVELFFVEMLLLQDASVSKMYCKVQEEIKKERQNPLRKNADEVIGDLVEEAAYTLNFMDYGQFYFPTVRVSAQKVAKAFGIDAIHLKFEQNKAVLEHMIRDHKAELDKKENAIKNRLLIILTGLSGIATIREAFDLITQEKYGAYSYYIAIGVMALGVSLYLGIRAVVHNRIEEDAHKKLERHRNRKG